MVEIDLDRISLEFKVRQFKRLTLKEFLVRGMFKRAANPILHVQALQDVTLRVDEGERLGILGHNGAGKSTLLKLLAGIYPPTSGTRKVMGRTCSLFDIALGFELQVIAACLIGGVAIAGGVGSAVGVVLGCLFIGVIRSSLPLVGISPFWQMFINGAVILVAVLVSARRRESSRKILEST